MSKPRGRAILPGETVSVRLRYAPRCCRMTGTMYRHGLLALPEKPCVSQLRVDRWVFVSYEATVGQTIAASGRAPGAKRLAPSSFALLFVGVRERSVPKSVATKRKHGATARRRTRCASRGTRS